MTAQDRTGRLHRLATLLDPVRRRLYDHVATQREPVGRDAAAAAVGISRRLAAFHLDKLADAGLLTASYRRLTGRDGPGAGRPAKLYARHSEEVHVSVPPRDYELGARVFVRTIASLGAGAETALQDAAAAVGRDLARSVPGGLEEVLACVGYEPHRDGDALRLRNCPFHRLAAEHRTLMCTANLHLLRAVLDETAPDALAELAPVDGECCVRVDVL